MRSINSKFEKQFSQTSCESNLEINCSFFVNETTTYTDITITSVDRASFQLQSTNLPHNYYHDICMFDRYRQRPTYQTRIVAKKCLCLPFYPNRTTIRKHQIRVICGFQTGDVIVIFNKKLSSSLDRLVN